MDKVDRHIVAALIDNARASFTRIGAAVGLSAPAVKRRVDRLLTDRVIQGFTAVVEPKALGWHVEAFVEVSLDERTHARELRKICEPLPEIIEVYMITGDPDALMHIMARDMTHLETILLRLRKNRTIKHTKSTVTFSRVLHREVPHTGIRSDLT